MLPGPLKCSISNLYMHEWINEWKTGDSLDFQCFTENKRPQVEHSCLSVFLQTSAKAKQSPLQSIFGKIFNWRKTLKITILKIQVIQ